MFSKKKIISTLCIQQLILEVYLGWPADERKTKQTIQIDVNMQFPELPKGCLTDELSETICYKNLVDIIEKNIVPREYRLVENLAYAIYRLIKKNIPQEYHVQIALTKHPAMLPQARRGVCFTVGDPVLC